MIKHVGRNSKGRLLCAAAAAALASQAAAQTEPAANPVDTRDDPEILVTGSRIARPNLDSPNPVATFNERAVETSGSVFLGDVLSRLPQFGATANASSNANNATLSGTVNLDLRRLGPNRTLVLINGRRQVGGGGGTAAVDVNTIPSSLIERIEVLTGGASAIYGADAVSGAVNFILREDFEGAKFNAQYGDSSEGSTGTLNLSGVVGTNFAGDRGNIAIAVDYSNVSELFADERSFRRASIFPISNPADPFFDQSDVPDFVFTAGIRDPNFTSNGVILNFAQEDFEGHVGTRTDVFQLAPGGNIVAFDSGQLVEFGDSAISGEGTLSGPLFGNSFLPGVERLIGNVLAHYDVVDDHSVFFEAKFARIRTDTQTSLERRTLALFNDNAFLSDQGRAFLAGRNANRVNVNRVLTEIGRRRLEADRDTYRLVGGVSGSLSENLRYETSVQYSVVDNSVTTRGQLVPAKLFAAADAVIDTAGLVGPAGQAVCRVRLQQAQGLVPRLPNNAIAPDYTINGCVPFNFLGEGAPSDAAKAFVTSDHTATEKQDQFVANATLTGDLGSLLTLPGGAPKFAVGAEYRRETATATPSALARLGVFGTIPAALSGDFDVKEAYTEVVLPILADMPFAEELTLNGAYRISDYSTIGTTHTWNLGGIWAPVQAVRFRASASKAVRAPNLSELFAAQSVTSQFAPDPCSAAGLAQGSSSRRANCQALGIPATGLTGPFVNFDVISGGNPNLDPETSKSHSFGVVLRPDFLPRLTLSLDYWSYKINGAISTANLRNIVERCVDAPALDPSTCGLIVRDPTTQLITRVTASQSNFQRIEAAGVDGELNYTHPTSFGSLGLNLSVTYNDKLRVFPFRAFPTESTDYVGFLGFPGVPKWNGALRATGQFGPVELTYRARGVSSINYDPSPASFASDPNLYSPSETGFRSVHDVNVSYNLSEQVELYAGVNNIFQSYPAFGLTGAGSFSAIFDNIGRFFYGGVRVKFGRN